jgi:hypothetical protein
MPNSTKTPVRSVNDLLSLKKEIVSYHHSTDRDLPRLAAFMLTLNICRQRIVLTA